VLGCFFIEWVLVCGVWGLDNHWRVFRMGTRIPSTNSEYYLSDFHDERPDRHHLPVFIA
jgi:hypothetical protein